MLRNALLTLSTVILISTLTVTTCPAGETWWQHDPAESGDWFDPANWTAGVPGVEDYAYIDNGGTAMIAYGDTDVWNLHVGWGDGATGSVTQVGGALALGWTLRLGGRLSSSGAYELLAGNLSTCKEWIGDSRGTGRFTQIGGTHSVNSNLYLGELFGSHGTYTLIGGELLARQVVVGHKYGRGHFEQTGGINTIGWQLKVGDLPQYYDPSQFDIDSSFDSYELIGGRLLTTWASIGTEGRGEFIQTGGIHTIEETLSIAGSQRYEFLEYVTNAHSLGLINEPNRLKTTSAFEDMGMTNVYISPQPLPTPEGRYELIGGVLSSKQTIVGTVGQGEFIQTGGVHTVEDTLTIGGPRQQLPWLWNPWGPVLIPIDGPPYRAICPDQLVSTNALTDSVTTNVVILPPTPSEGRYELSGGRLNSQQVEINYTGLMRQTGGANRTDYLSINSGGRYEYLGGSLKIAAGLDLDGELDFCNSSANLVGGRSLLNFSRGKILNAENASISVGPDSLTIFAGDFDPHTQLKHFHTAGLVHFAGSDLILSADQGFTGWGSIDDHVETSGHIIATDGGGINLRSGLFVHEGTVNLGDEQLMVRNDRSGISSGQLAAGSMIIRSDFCGVVLFDDTFIPCSPALFRQTGGVNTVSGDITVMRGGTYELHHGEFSARNVGVNGAALSTCARCVQTGGTCKIEDTLYVGRYSPSLLMKGPPNIIVPFNQLLDNSLSCSGSDGAAYPESGSVGAIYQLSGGYLSAERLKVEGAHGQHQFIQTGGIVGVRSKLSVWGYGSSYTIFGGSLTVPVLEVGKVYYSYQRGTLAILGADSEINVSQCLSFGRGSTFVAVPGSTIHVTGPTDSQVRCGGGGRSYSTFENYSTDPAALAGLGNLTLIFEGGDEFVATFEVAGEDRGPGLGGFFENFVLDTLQIGGEDVAQVRLVDWIDNQPGWEGSEALYVKNLIISPGSYLDLNGLNLYYLNFIDLGGAVNLSSGNMRQIPEPATLSLLALGGLVLLRRKRKQSAPA